MYNKRRILIVTTSDRMAGAEKSIFNILRFANRTKYEFRLVVFKSEENGELVKKISSLGIQAESLNINYKWQFFKLIKLWNIIKSFNPDILESFLFFDNQVCRIFGKIAKVKCIISGLRNVETKRSFFRDIIERFTINWANIIISNTEAGKDFYVQNNYLSSEKVFVINNGIDINYLESLQNKFTAEKAEEVFNLSLYNKIPKIIMVGYLKEQKGIIYLIKAVGLLKRKGLILDCYIVGQGHLEKKLKDEVILEKVNDRINFIGYISEVYGYFKFFDLFVLPSIWEGSPNVILESMASELPVISTSVGGVGEILKDNVTGFLVKPGSVESLVEKIEYYFSLRKYEVDNIKKSAYEMVKENFSIEAMVKKYEFYYDKGCLK